MQNDTSDPHCVKCNTRVLTSYSEGVMIEFCPICPERSIVG